MGQWGEGMGNDRHIRLSGGNEVGPRSGMIIDSEIRIKETAMNYHIAAVTHNRCVVSAFSLASAYVYLSLTPRSFI